MKVTYTVYWIHEGYKHTLVVDILPETSPTIRILFPRGHPVADHCILNNYFSSIKGSYDIQLEHVDDMPWCMRTLYHWTKNLIPIGIP